MCEITTSGCKMEDGTTYDYSVKLGDILPDHIQQMNDSSATVWAVFLLHNKIDCILEKLGAPKRKYSSALKYAREALVWGALIFMFIKMFGL